MRRRSVSWIASVLPVLFGALGVLLPSGDAGAQSRTCPGGGSAAATVVTLDGKVSAEGADGVPVALSLGTALCPGDGVSTGADGRVELRFAALDTTVGLSRNSSLRLPPANDTDANVDMTSGVMRFISSVRTFFTVRTRHANAGIDGTEAVIVVDDALDASLFVTQEGDVGLTAHLGQVASLALARGQSGYISQTADLALATTASVPEAFRGLVADPAGASDWAIYFPPVLDGAAPEGARQAAAMLDSGDVNGAESLLAGHEDAASLSLRAVVAILRNRRGEGGDLANRAVAADPSLGAAHLAQSYALQAQGQVAAARRAAARAVEASPSDANARARLAELLLTEGDRAGALDVVSAIGPGAHTANSRAVEGLAALSVNDQAGAVAAFEAGIALDSEAPLPRLGLGLAKIRMGDLAGGRQELELAAALDPRRATIRTWLGRAYGAEGLAEKAASQFEEAKARDPDDPTPWLFSAQDKFAANRPVEALRDLGEAEARGQGRTPVRTEGGLGEDRAVRGAARGQVAQVLGFRNQSIVLGTAAVEADPTSPAAHFLLADVLGDRPGRELARTSAQLQGQVYDPPGKTLIRPQLSESDLALLQTPGAARATLHEFAPFFDSDGIRAEATIFGGTQETWGEELAATVLHQGFSLGVGQFHYATDGFNANNDVTHDIVSVQGKAQLAPSFGVFGEYRYRNTEQGDRMLEFDLSEFAADLLEQDERHLARVGFHSQIGARHDLAGVFTFVDQDNFGFLPGDDIGFSSFETFGDRKAYEGQLQHVGRFGALTTVSGLSYGHVDSDVRDDLVLNFDIFCGIDISFCDLVIRDSTFVDSEISHFSAYHYSTLRFDDLPWIASAELTGGLSVDVFDDSIEGGRDTTQVNPKVGARVEVVDGLVLRGAYTHALKGDLLLDQRLEPVTVAGFIQSTDQVAGSTIRQAAVGVDAEVLPWLWLGGEAAWRWVEVPLFDLSGDTTDTDEREFRGYANAILGDNVAASLEVSHERSESPLGLSDLELFEVTELHAGAAYFHPSGFFASAGIGYVWHEFQGFGSAGSDDFPIADAMVGFRLPDERGVISLQVQNAFDKSFGFEDRPLLSLGATTAEPRFAREFSAIARVTLSF